MQNMEQDLEWKGLTSDQKQYFNDAYTVKTRGKSDIIISTENSTSSKFNSQYDYEHES